MILEIATQFEVDAVFGGLNAQIDRYGFATIADLYRLTDQTPTYEQDQNGWWDLSEVRVTKTDGGYSLEFPDSEKIIEKKQETHS